MPRQGGMQDVTHVGGWLSLPGSNGHAPLKRADRIRRE
jgi:hypothetical protein